ncbi:MAG: type II toxin-antitoxin system VapC family toxin [Actinobacteria bacterium]|nr:type II toxin-antitoxin system VapC family toxin [Actinomycetota bacterium]
MPSRSGNRGSVLLLDTSVVVKWYIEEENSVEALTIRDSFLDDRLEIFFPDLGLYELANALRYSGLFSEEEIQLYLQSAIDIGMQIVPIDPSVLKAAISLSLARNLAVYDSYFAALADSIGAIYITADEKALKKLSDLMHVEGLARRK